MPETGSRAVLERPECAALHIARMIFTMISSRLKAPRPHVVCGTHNEALSPIPKKTIRPTGEVSRARISAAIELASSRLFPSCLDGKSRDEA